jgi:hypothetical protein
MSAAEGRGGENGADGGRQSRLRWVYPLAYLIPRTST